MGNRNDSRRGNENRTPVPRVVATASNNSRRGTNSSAETLRGGRGTSSRRSSATSSNDPAQTLAISTAHPPSGTSAQPLPVRTASNNSRRGTNSSAETLQGSRNISSHQSSATSSNDRATILEGSRNISSRRSSATSSNDPAQTLAISTAHPPSGPSAQPLPVRTASNNSRRGTNSSAETLQGSRNISSRQSSATSSNDRVTILHGSRNISSRRSSATSSNDPVQTLAISTAHPPSGPSAQPLPVRTASNNSRRGTNSSAETLQGSRNISSRQSSATPSNDRATILQGSRNISSRRPSATSSNDRATTLANSSAHPPSN